MEFKTIKELYDHSINTYGGNVSFSMFERERMTYEDFGERVEYVKGMLLGAGITHGDNVAILSTNMPNWGVCYFAIVTSGMVAVPILPDFSGDELDNLLAHSEAKALMVSDKLFTKISKETIDSMQLVVRTKNLGIISRKHSVELGEAAVPKPDDTAVIIYTSGTTSNPKGVMLSQYNIARQIKFDFDLFNVRQTDVFLSILPLSHTYECSLGFLLPFMSGASVVYLDRPPTISYLAKAMSKVRPTMILSVPLIIEKTYKKQILAPFSKTAFTRWAYRQGFIRHWVHRIAGRKLRKLFGGRLRFFGIGGAKLDKSAEQFLMDAKFPYGIGYGLTETAPLLAGAVPDKVRLGSTGPVLPGIEHRLDNVNPETGEGELVVKTPCVMQGYYKNPELTAEMFTEDGWFRTMDLCRFDQDGYLYVLGRSSNMIVGPSGENIYPEDIESVLNTHSLIMDSIVTQEEGKLTALVAFDREELERRYKDFKDNMSAKMDEIKADIMKYVNSKVNKSSQVMSVKEQEEGFEKTPTHKIKRGKYTKEKDKGGEAR